MTPVKSEMPRTLVVACHFPPAIGGIQTFIEELLARLDPTRVVVVTTQAQDDVAALRAYPLRHVSLSALAAELPAIVRRSGSTAAWLPSAVPYSMLAPILRKSGIRWIVASSHGQELAWMRSPASRAVLRRMFRQVDVLTYLGSYTRERLEGLGPAPYSLHRLAGGVDGSAFPERSSPRPLGGRPTVVAVSRLVPRKGHDRLIAAWPSVLQRLPDAQLIVVGDGPLRWPLESMSRMPLFEGSVQVVGRLSSPDLLSRLHRADVFISPSRDFLVGLQVEGLGLSALEAAATGLPVIVGQSGGSPDSLVPNRTGFLIDASRATEISNALVALLLHQDQASEFGRAGAQWVREHWTWEAAAGQLTRLLSGHLPKMFCESNSGHNSYGE